MIVRTASGSIYEFDQAKKQVRRIEGVHNPTPRQGKDGEWKAYASLHKVEGCLLITWNLEDTSIPATITSPIISEHQDNPEN